MSTNLKFFSSIKQTNNFFVIVPCNNCNDLKKIKRETIRKVKKTYISKQEKRYQTNKKKQKI